MADISALIAYYQSLLAYQYADKENAKGTIAALVRAAACDLVAIEIREGFNLDTAVGDQLDVLGEYIGLSRLVNVDLEGRDYWRLRDYEVSEVVTGLTDYEDALTNSGVLFYRYLLQQLPAYVMTDDEYRFMLRFKAASNSSDNTLYGIRALLDEYFSGQLGVWDFTDMTLGYYVDATLETYVKIAIASNLLPRPMGVRIVGVFTVADPALVFYMADYDTGANIGVGMNDYDEGFETDWYWLDYDDALTTI